jgi:raffinose/stachyose/melibiose transport system permease protein
MSDKDNKVTYKFLRLISLTIFAMLIIIPSAIVLLGSSKTDAEVYNKPLALPERWNLDNFRFLFEVSNVGKSFINSVIVTGVSVTITLILASLCAFAISRMFTITGKILFSLFAVGLAIPGQVNIVPIFILFNDLKLTDKLSGLILINVVTTLPISIFILTAFFRELPKEMFEVSQVDGATPFRVYRSIALPLSRPAMGATAIFLFVITWNELLFPLLLINDTEKRTLPLSLLSFRGEFFSSYSMIFTAVMVASIPMVIMYLFMQRSFIAGLTAGAVKG